MSIFDEESMMFTTDWKSLEEAFIRRANAAGYYGLDVYKYSETVTIPETPQRKIWIDSSKSLCEAAEELGYRAGQEISKLLVN